MQWEFRMTNDHLGFNIALSTLNPDGTKEYEGLGSSLGEALQDLADNVQSEDA